MGPGSGGATELPRRQRPSGGQRAAAPLPAGLNDGRIKGKSTLWVFEGLKACRGDHLRLMPRIELLLLLRLDESFRFLEEQP